MERTKHSIMLIFLMFHFLLVYADNKSEIYAAYTDNNMALWKRVIDRMQAQPLKSRDFVLELINYQYGYIGWCLGNDQRDEAAASLALAEKNLEVLEKSGYKPSLVYAYKSAFYGFRIGLNPLKAPVLGPRSVDCAKKAMQLDKFNPYAYLQYANAEYYMPAVFGGSKEKAIEYYKRAEALMELVSRPLKGDWNYLSLLATLGRAYAETRNYKMAKIYYEKALSLEPGFLWVKKELLPQLMQTTKSRK